MPKEGYRNLTVKDAWLKKIMEHIGVNPEEEVCHSYGQPIKPMRAVRDFIMQAVDEKIEREKESNLK